MSESGSKARTGSDIFDDTFFHENFLSSLSLSEASDVHQPITPSGTGPPEAASPGSIPVLANETLTLGPLGQYILVYDVRRSTGSVLHPEICQTSHVSLDPMKVKKIVAERYKTSQDYVISSQENANNIAVITDQELQKKNIFLFFNIPFVMNFTGINTIGSTFCVGVDEEITVSEFINAHFKKLETDDIETIYLFMQGKIYKNSTQRFVNLGLSRLVECKFIKQFPLKVRCHYHCTPDVEIVYHLNCFNTDSVGELKAKFCQQFEKEFPVILDDSKEIWFSSSSRILKDTDYFLVEGERSRNEFGMLITRLEDITIQVSSNDSIPVKVSYIDLGKRVSTKVLVTERKPSTEDLRLKIGKHFNQEPNSLKLKLNQKKLCGSTLMASQNGFQLNDHIFAEYSSKKTFKVEIFVDDRIISSRSVKMYKNDKVSHLKALLASSENIDDFLIELNYSGCEMERDKRLNEYHIGPEDVVTMVIHENRIKLKIRCSGYPSQYITIDDARTTTVMELKSYLSGILEISSSRMNLVLDGKCLNNSDTLTEIGIKSLDTLVASKFWECERKYDGELFPVYVPDEFGVAHSVKKALLHREKLLYVLDGELGNTTGNQQLLQTETVPKGIRLLKVKQNERFTDGFLEQRINKGHDLQNLCPDMDSTTTIKYPDRPKTITQEYVSDVESTPSTSTSEDEILQQKGVSSTSVTTKSQTMTPCLTMASILPIPSTAVATQSVYQKRVLKHKDGTVIKAESHASHTTLSKEKLAEMDYQTSYDLPSQSVSFSKESSKNPLLYSVAELLGNDWQRLTLNLGLGQKAIECCECKSPKDLIMQAYNMLCLWNTKNGKSAKKEALILALKECQLNNIAEKLEELSTDD